MDLIKSSSLKDITSYQKTIDQDQQIQPRIIKEVIKKDIPSGSDHKYGVASKGEVSKEKGFFSKVARKLSSILRNG